MISKIYEEIDVDFAHADFVGREHNFIGDRDRKKWGRGERERERKKRLYVVLMDLSNPTQNPNPIPIQSHRFAIRARCNHNAYSNRHSAQQLLRTGIVEMTFANNACCE